VEEEAEEENSVTISALAEVEGGRRMSKSQQVNARRGPGTKNRLKYAARAASGCCEAVWELWVFCERTSLPPGTGPWLVCGC
jgi:hypothetical protein